MSEPVTPPELHDCSLTLDGGACVLTLGRDDVRNALTGTRIVDDIVATVAWINASSDIGALVITGAGSAFSSGGNVKDMAQRRGLFGLEPHEMPAAYRHGIQRMTLAMHGLDVPAIAAVNGPAIGAGFDLACMCDIRYAAPGARFGETFVNLGLISGDGGAWHLPRIIGPQRAAELIFSGRIIDAPEALSIGLVLEVVPAERLVAQALALARQFAGKPRLALRMNKRLLQASARLGLADFLDLCANQQSLCHVSEQHHRALAEFLDRHQ